MLKFLIIMILIVYVFYKTAGFFFRLVFGPMRTGSGNFQQGQRNYSKKAPDSNLNIDNVPDKSENKSGYKGGEYVDFEEVK